MSSFNGAVRESEWSWDDIPPVRESNELSPDGSWGGRIGGLKYAGLQPSQFKPEGRRTIFVGFVFTDAAGKPHRVWKRYTHTLSQLSDFYALVVAALGKAFSRRKDGGFDVGLLFGRPVLVEIEHVTKGGRTYADVASVSRLPAGMAAPKVEQPMEVPQWILDVAAKRLDPPPQAEQSAPTAPSSAAPEGDGIEEWAKLGFCQGDDVDDRDDDGSVVEDSEV